MKDPGIFMIVIFFGERWEVTPFLGIIYMDGYTIGENYLIFYSFFIVMVFIGILLLWIIYRYYRVKHCSNLPEDMETIDL